MADLPSKHAVHFEAVKIAMNQTKDGWKLILAVHPNDAPEEVLRSLVGSRYMIAAVELDDQDKPKPILTEPEKDVQYAARLCREPKFQQWLTHNYYPASTEDEAARVLRHLLSIGSRSTIATNEDVRRRFRELAEQYLDSG